MHFRLAGICPFPGPILAWLQGTNSLCHPRWKHPGKTASFPCWWHQNHSAQPAQPLSWSALTTACRVPAMDAGCGLSTGRLLAGPAICNESQLGWRHIAIWSVTWWCYFVNYCFYINYFNWNEIINIIEIIYRQKNNWINWKI